MSDTAQAPPEPVRLTDLHHPTFTAVAREVIDFATPIGAELSLDAESLVAQARADTGLDDFGDDGFREPLGVLVDALDHEAGLSPFGRVSTHTQLVQALRNRLLVEDLLRRHPEIHELEVRSPIIIAGLPRTGTTHLHNLLAADGRLRSLPYWESLEPVLDPNEPVEAGVDPRIARTDAALDFLHQALPYFNRMHEMTTWHVHEEIQLLAISFSTMLFDTIAPMPSWRAHYRTTDQTPHYRYLETILKVLQYTRGGDRWVLKSPQHLEQFSVLRTVFPDSTVVVTHRDPVSVTASMVTMLAYTARLTLEPVPVDTIGRFWTDLLDEMLASCAATRSALGDNAVDVHFDRFMADDLATVETIYELADLPFTEEARSSMAAYVHGHPRGRHGQIIYDFDDLGLDPDAMRARFADYVERFGVVAEHGPAAGTTSRGR